MEFKRSIYRARVTLIDTESYKRDWYKEGNAEKVLFEAIEYIGMKESGGIFDRMITYIVKDWDAFNTKMNKLILGNKNGNKK